ncbi:MAG: SDR family NAD(P)-dependent oxidoreductase [Kiritimatiellia bacterium]|nr:SDR family NAD(P)-dependent oxidoreductase [Kiritimatiellia bacterium]MDP6811002.1 SDR family NAD(P)-dependent oxidoreductase [Kiritimatiellia bacterium]MDP7023143.1 SDR family NAD(P)-dependent oxidoreductase [Kiritimatiellia bacterium]
MEATGKMGTPLVIRMTCARELAALGLPLNPPNVRVCAAGGEAEIRCEDGSESIVAAAVTDFIRKHRCLPRSVGVEGGDLFEVTPAREGRLAGCVAMVTGSAQGFGKGIAEEMAAAGASIVVADLNAELGEAVASELCKAHGEQAAVFCEANVTSPDSLNACVEAAVAAFGGLDMLVANAGVLKAGGLDEMDEAAFDFVTSVNYKGYFLCTQAVVPVMKLQNRICADWFMDIVQVNSKSGLEGSRRNFAYAGGKFGGIGLTQSFALELVPFNIKVNSVCPGNFFEGPLWSDPEKGLFVQYLNAGKVPGATTVEEVREFYLSQVPMHRGCSPRDVTIAIFYLHEQQYETGQAVPVTGGQVMLN